MKKLIIYTDGGARGNPGPAGAGVVIYEEDKKKLEEHSKFLGHRTNNQAEYEGVILGLEKAKKFKVSEIDFYLDSELVASQLSGKYKVKDQDLAPLFIKIWNATINYKKINYFHVERERNKEADRMVNEAIDRGVKS